MRQPRDNGVARQADDLAIAFVALRLSAERGTDASVAAMRSPPQALQNGESDRFTPAQVCLLG